MGGRVLWVPAASFGLLGRGCSASEVSRICASIPKDRSPDGRRLTRCGDLCRVPRSHWQKTGLPTHRSASTTKCMTENEEVSPWGCQPTGAHQQQRDPSVGMGSPAGDDGFTMVGDRGGTLPSSAKCRRWQEWAGEDLNLRRLCRRVYSPFPLATRAPTQRGTTLPAREVAALLISGAVPIAPH